MKVLLIYPPLNKIVKTQHPDSIERDAPGRPPPLGLLYVASSVERSKKHTVEILDTIIDGLSYDDIERGLRKNQPDVVGIYSNVFTYRDVLRVAQLTKKLSNDIHVCLGGPLVAAYPGEVMQQKCFDSGVVGEGEISYNELLDCLDSGKPLNTVRGIVYKENGRIIITPPRNVNRNLDSLPFPARHLTPYKKYYDLIGRQKVMTTISTSRGCPNRCLFCNRIELDVYRPRSPKNVVDEIEHCLKMGIEEFFFIDDTFTCDRPRAIGICDEIVKRKLNIKWDIRTRVDALDEELIKKLKTAGCTMIRIGVESGSDRILRQLNKKITVVQIEETVELLQKHKIDFIPYILFGNPTETREEIMESISFTIKMDPIFAVFGILLILPKTDLFYRGLKEGIFKEDFWREFILNPTDDFTPLFWEERFTLKELSEILALAHSKFYRRPRYLFNRLVEIRSIEDLKRKFGVGIRILLGV